MSDEVRHSYRFLNEQKSIFGKVCTQPSDCLKSNAKDIQGELLVVLGKTQSRIVYMGKQHYLPILLADYDAKTTWLRKKLAAAH